MACNPGTPRADAAALTARRERVRGFVEGFADHVMANRMPETFLEADRAVRAITRVDRFLQSCPPPEADLEPLTRQEIGAEVVRDRHRLALRVHADKVMDAGFAITKTDDFLEGERAMRFAAGTDRMLVQLYEAPKPGRRVSPEDMDDDDADPGMAWVRRTLGRFDGTTRAYAHDWGFWPDGTAYADGEDDPEAHMYLVSPEADADEALQHSEAGRDIYFPLYLLHRLNRIAVYYARHHGKWPDGKPWSPGDPTNYLHMAANFFDNGPLLPDEIYIRGPWWIVRKAWPHETASDPPPS